MRIRWRISCSIFAMSLASIEQEIRQRILISGLQIERVVKLGFQITFNRTRFVVGRRGIARDFVSELRYSWIKLARRIRVEVPDVFGRGRRCISSELRIARNCDIGRYGIGNASFETPGRQRLRISVALKIRNGSIKRQRLLCSE